VSPLAEATPEFERTDGSAKCVCWDLLYPEVASSTVQTRARDGCPARADQRRLILEVASALVVTVAVGEPQRVRAAQVAWRFVSAPFGGTKPYAGVVATMDQESIQAALPGSPNPEFRIPK
jgi:hypothetical protein